MHHTILLSLLAILLSGLYVQAAETTPNLEQLMREAELRASVRALSEGALLEESTSAEQAVVQARSRAEYGLELRTGLTAEDVGLGLRIYLPDRWSKTKLREQLLLVAQSEQLRVATLEWQEITAVYRDFCTYRMLNKQLSLYADELQTLKPYLMQANLSVLRRELSVGDRTKLYGLYLNLLNNREQVELELIGVQLRLHLALGSTANLETFSQTAIIEPPGRFELGALTQQALVNRADYRQLDVEAQALTAAEAVARSEDGFRLKYIQPGYNLDTTGGNDNNWVVTAAFILPWGTRNPDIAVYQQQRMLAVSTMNQQRIIMEERLRVLINAATAINEQIEQRNQQIHPLLSQLEADLKQLESGPLEQLRDVLLIRERIFDSTLQTIEAEHERERITVDLAEEIGTLNRY